MNISRVLLFGAFLLFTLTGSFVCRMFGKGHESVVPIMRNVVWYDFVSQIRFLPDDSPEDSFAKGNADYPEIPQSARNGSENRNLRPRSIQGH